MGTEAIALLACLLLGSAAVGQGISGVLLKKQDALAIMSRHKRANTNNEESHLPPNLERECIEELCHYEEAREVFQDTYRTDIFWSVYIDGDQCASKPCKNSALCSDSVGGYDCICKTGFSGVHCETDQTLCVLDATKGCSQFCKPGYQAYECSCARGWKPHGTQKEKCIPAVSFPCGKVDSLSQWETRRSTNIRTNYEGLSCGSGECPWQALLQSAEGPFCNGVILKENLVLTTAQCATRYSNFQVVVGKRTISIEDGEQLLYVKTVHAHPRFVEGRPDNDMAVVELRNRISFRKTVVAACLPERDFAENVLMTGERDAVITGWKDGSQPLVLEGSLTLNHLTYEPLSQCAERHQGRITNKMFCTSPRPKADCTFAPGSPTLTLYRDVYFLTGVMSQPQRHNCHQGYVFQKISRFLPWLESLMDSK